MTAAFRASENSSSDPSVIRAAPTTPRVSRARGNDDSSARVIGGPSAAMTHLMPQHRSPAGDRKDDLAGRADLGEGAREVPPEAGGDELGGRQVLDDRHLVLRVDQRAAVV